MAKISAGGDTPLIRLFNPRTNEEIQITSSGRLLLQRTGKNLYGRRTISTGWMLKRIGLPVNDKNQLKRILRSYHGKGFRTKR